MNHYFMAIVFVTLIFSIVIINLICKIHELHVKIEELNKYVNEVLDVVKGHTIITNKIMDNVDEHLNCQNEKLRVINIFIDGIDQYIRKEVKDELNAIGRTTTEQADIMLKIEEKINELELERPDKKEGDVIESERIPAACIEN